MSTISVDYDVLNQRGSPAWFSDTFANIPTAGFKGRMFISTDTFAFYRDTGTGWDLIGGPGIGTLTGSGAAGQVSFFNGTQTITGNNNLFWDNTNSRLGIGTITPGQSLDIHSTGNTLVQLNNTTTANSNISFQNQNVAKWRVGNVYNAGANSFDILNATTSTTALSISNTTNAATFNNSVTASSLIKSGGTSSQFLKADGSIDSNSYITLTSLSFVAGSGAYSNTTGVITIPTNNNQITNGSGYITSSALSSYLPLTGGTLTGALVINPTNTLTIGLDVASNTTRFRSDNLEGFKRQLEITMGSGTLVQLVAKGYLANYGTDMAFYTATTGGTNASPGIYITGTNNRVGIKTGTPAYDLDVSGTFGASSTGYFGSTLLLAKDNVIGINTTNGTDNGYLAICGASGDGEARGGHIYLSGNERVADPGTIVIASGDVGTINFRTGAGLERMRITSGGNVLIGKTSDNGAKFQVFGNTRLTGTTNDSGANTIYCENNLAVDLFYVRNDGLFVTGTASVSPYNYTTGSAANLFVNANGHLLRSTSSLKYKTDIKIYNKGLDEVLKMNPVYYKSKNDNITQFAGLIAEEIHDLGLIEFVQYAKDGSPDAIAYSNMIAIVIKAIQELNEKLIKNNIN